MSKSDNSRTKIENGYGVHFIHDPDHILSYQPLADLFSEFKKLLRESEYNVSVCGNFYRIGNTEVKCTFFLDLAYAAREGINQEDYQKAFRETFRYWVAGFDSLIQSIIFDVKHADSHTEESVGTIAERIFAHYSSGLKAKRSIYYTNQPKLYIKQQRAKRKADKAKRKAEARKKKAAQQNSSHMD